VIVYSYDAGIDIVAILTVQDGRTPVAATTAP